MISARSRRPPRGQGTMTAMATPPESTKTSLRQRLTPRTRTLAPAGRSHPPPRSVRLRRRPAARRHHAAAVPAALRRIRQHLGIRHLPGQQRQLRGLHPAQRLPGRHPEEALDCACGLYLNDPTAWLTTTPDELTGATTWISLITWPGNPRVSPRPSARPRPMSACRRAPGGTPMTCCGTWAEVQWFWGTIVRENATRQQAEDLKPERPAAAPGCRTSTSVRAACCRNRWPRRRRTPRPGPGRTTRPSASSGGARPMRR